MRNKIFKTFSVVIFLMVFSKGLGFIRESLIAAKYGAGFISDVYVFEDGIINAIYTVCAGVISTTYIPKLLSLQNEDKDRFTSNYFNILCSIIIGIAAILALFSSFVLKIFVPGFYNIYSADVMNSLEVLTRINMISLLLVFTENYFIVVLQAHNYFIFSSIQGIILNVSLIVYLLFFYQYEILGIIIVKILAHFINALMLLIFINGKKLFKYSFIYKINDPNIVSVAKLASPVLIVNIVSQLNYIVDRAMASGLDSGSMALLSYANTVAALIYSVIGISFNNIVYTSLSEKQDDDDEVRKLFAKYKSLLLSILLPCCIVMFVDSKNVCNIIYGRGAMNENNIKILSLLLIIYIPSNFALCIRDLYNRLLYIHKKTKITSFINLGGLILNIVLNVILSKLLGVYGLAIATSLTGILIVTITKLYCKNYIEFHVRELLTMSIKTIIVGLACVAVKIILLDTSVIWEIVTFLISVGLALLIFNLGAIKKGIS